MTLSGLHGASVPGERSLGIRREMEKGEISLRARAPINARGGPSLKLNGKNGIANQITAAQSLLPDPVIGRFLGTKTFRTLRTIADPDYHPVAAVIVGAIPVVDSRNVGGPGDRRVAIGPSVVLNDRKSQT